MQGRQRRAGPDASFRAPYSGGGGVVRTKKGRTLHSEGRKLPFNGEDMGSPVSYAAELAAALRREMQKRPAAAKVVMHWTGASERTVKAWLVGSASRAESILSR
jgi:hypothetical protein